MKGGADVERWNLERRSEYLEEELQAIRGRVETLGGSGETMSFESKEHT